MSAYCLLKPDLNSRWLDIGLSESTQQPSLSECISIVLWFMWLSVFMCCVVNLLAPTHLPADKNRWSVGPLHPYTVFLCRPMRNCCWQITGFHSPHWLSPGKGFKDLPKPFPRIRRRRTIQGVLSGNAFMVLMTPRGSTALPPWNFRVSPCEFKVYCPTPQLGKEHLFKIIIFQT